MDKLFLLTAAISGFMAVALGAFGAHGLRGKLPENLMTAFQTGVEYQFYHTLVLLAVAILIKQTSMLYLNVTGYLLIAGIVLFSGSLYLLAFGGPRWLGPITPLGGLCFMAAWLLLAFSVFKS